MGETGFLNLPRELRDIIYKYYVLENGGYHFNYESGKLRAADRPVDLSLMYTCTTIASEMHGLALGSNIITFSTHFSESENLKAGRQNLLMNDHVRAQEYIIALTTSQDTLRIFRTPEVDADLYQKYPRFMQPLDQFEGQMLGAQWDGPGSKYREFLRYALKLLSEQPAFVETFANYRSGEMRPFLLSEFFSTNFDPWAILSEDEIVEIDQVLPAFTRRDLHLGTKHKNFWRRVKWHYSAASMVVHFFKSISHDIRLQIRKVILEEDRPSIACPECHAFGLIPFCLENPQLHVERRLNLWRNVLPTGSIEISRMVYPESESESSDEDTEIDDRIHSSDIGYAFGPWIEEALALPEAGMPFHSFSLVFDGNPNPDQSSEVFDMVKHNAAYQVAADEWFMQNSMEPTVRERKSNGHWRFEAFPQAIKDMIEGKSFIRCNFPLGNALDVKSILDKNEGYDLADWRAKFYRHYQPPYFKTLPPLPDWIDLRLEELLPEE